MTADLTCRCQSTTLVARDINDLCFDCRGSGRRPPTLAEWDALTIAFLAVQADRDRYQWALRLIADSGAPGYAKRAYSLVSIARAALDAKEGP